MERANDPEWDSLVMFPDDNAVVLFRDGNVVGGGGDVSRQMEAILDQLRTVEEVQKTILSALRRMSEEGGGHNYLILEVGRCRYVQFATSCGSAMVYGEVSSGRYCKPGCTCPPTASQRVELRRLGWRPPTRRKFLNFYRWWPLIGERDREVVADTALATLRLFGWPGEPVTVKFHLDW